MRNKLEYMLTSLTGARELQGTCLFMVPRPDQNPGYNWTQQHVGHL
jgi:hypothetical protein